MKTLFCLLFGLSICYSGFAQLQELEQLKLDLEKLAQFKIMLSQMKSGYQNLVNGYNSVRDAGRSNFNLHQNFLEGLFQVSEQVKGNPTVGKIYESQNYISQSAKSLLSSCRTSGVFSVNEIETVSQACTRIMENVSADTELLNNVLTPGDLSMDDGERTSTIEMLQKSIEKQKEKLKTLSDQYNKVMIIRLQQKRDMQTFKRLTTNR